jgi:PAS domain S-box-containing protein
MVKKTNIVLTKKAGELTASRFRALLENAYDGIVLYDSTGVIQYASPSIKVFLGYNNHDVLGRRGTDFLHQEDVEDAREIFYKVLMQAGKSITQVQRFVTKKGDVRWFEYTLTNLLQNPEVRGVVSNFRDIHERKAAEEKANKSQRLLSTISENIVDGIFFGIPGEEFQYVNRAFLEIFGYASLEDLRKLKPPDLYAEAERWREINALLTKDKNVKIEQVLFRKKNGDFFWGAISVTLFEDKSGQRFFAGSIQDITRQKQAEEQLLRSQQLLDSISKNVNEGIYRSSDKKLRYVNEALVAMFGYDDTEEVINLNPQELFADERTRKQLLKKLKKEKRLVNEQVLYKKKNGELFWGLMSGTLVKTKRGESFIDGAIRDITKQKEAEDKLQQSEQMLATISKNITEGIYRSIPNKEFAYVNRAFLELFGFKSLEELNEQCKPRDLYGDKKSLRLVRDQIKSKKEIQNVEALFKRKNGERFWGSISSILVEEPNGKIFFDGSIRDITKQKETEEQLNESRNFLDNVMRTVAAPIFVKDSKHRWIMFNDAFCWFMDKSRKELLNKTDRDFLSKEDSDVYWKTDNDVLRSGDVAINKEKITIKGKVKHLLTVKSRYVNDHGEKFVIGFITDISEIRKREDEISKLNANLLGVMESTHDSIYAIDPNFNYIAFNKNHARIAKLIYGGTISIGDNALALLKDTPERKWLKADFNRAIKGEHFVSEQLINQPKYKGKHIETTYNPIFDKKNRVTGVAVFVRDITERKKSIEKLKVLNDGLVSQNWKLAAQDEELKATLEELSERNFELDQLMYKTSHDLRSPLSSILGLVNLANLDPSKDNHIIYLNKIEGRIKKLDEFIKSMLNYARVNRSEVFYERIDLKETIESCVQELEYLDNFSSVKASIEIQNESIPFRSDPLRLRIVIGNLISNAYKYYDPSAKSYLKIHAVISPVVVEIVLTDNGIGIKKEYVDKVFDMFYRATEKSQGSGLGMYIVKQAVDKLRGSIKVKSTFGQGTTIKIVLPNN